MMNIELLILVLKKMIDDSQKEIMQETPKFRIMSKNELEEGADMLQNANEGEDALYSMNPQNHTELNERLRKYEKFESLLNVDLSKILSDLPALKKEYRKRFLIQTADKILKIHVEEIAWFFAHNKGVFMRTNQNQTYPVDGSLDSVEQLLDPIQFFRINRKFIVSISAITNMVVWSRGRIKLEMCPKCENGFEMVVSIDRANDFKKWLETV